MLRLFVIAVAVWLSASAAEAAERIALVIANARYSVLPILEGPEQDAKLVTDRLMSLGFKVTVKHDLTAAELKRAIADHAEALWQAGAGSIGMIYYSGHGIAEPGDRDNYLLPVEIAGIDERYLRDEALSLKHIIERLTIPDRSIFIVLDACRSEMRRASRGARGFTGTEAGPRFFIAYSTEAGNDALDGGPEGSPYTRALMRAMARRCADYQSIFKAAQIAVYDLTKGKQTPFVSDKLPALFALDAACALPTAPSITGPNPITRVTIDRMRIAVDGAAEPRVLSHVRLAVRDALGGDGTAATATHDLRVTATDIRNEPGGCGWQIVRLIVYQLVDRATGDDVVRGEVRGAVCLAAGDNETMSTAATRSAAQALVRDLKAKIERIGQ